MTYPAGPAAACSVYRSWPEKAASPSTADQVMPSDDTITTGCCTAPVTTPPTASQPAPLAAIPVSCSDPGRLSTGGVWPVALVQSLPPSVETHAAGNPFALPTATCEPAWAATALTATCGCDAPGTASMPVLRSAVPADNTLSLGSRALAPVITTSGPPA